MKSFSCAAVLLVVLFASGCASSRVKTLQAENLRLTSDLTTAHGSITRLEGEVKDLRQVNKTLQYEKKAQVDETADVRRSARTFVRGQVESLRDFAQSRSLLDYVGGETIERASVDGENVLLVDMKNAFENPGILVGARVLARTETRLVFCVLRPQGDGVVVLWMSAPFLVPAGEVAHLSFDTPVAAQKGDMIGAYAPDALGVPHDTGTGDTRAVSGPVEVGQSIAVSDMNGAQNRSYSFGVVGFLE